jgi:tetratricopeptide (TPR) repeat protein
MTALEDQARSIFLAALERAPDQWPAFMDEACGGNAELRVRVEELLHAHQSMGSIHGRGERTAAYQPVSAGPGMVIGPYKLVERIGEGGMGEVWLAQQQEPVKRQVALKLVKPGMDSRSVLARFEAERQALALMDHPNIAKVFDAGATPDGRPYFVMELVKGVRITQFCDERRLTPRQRLELFVPVCQALQHAHQKGVIHRDVKPSNVLVALYDDRPVPKVIDFGVAKAAGQQLTEKTLHTGLGAVVGTAEYMSPEQAGFNQLDVDTRSDVYALGVLLYELLTGSPPFTKKELAKAGMLEMLRVIREQEPSRPSAKLSTAEGLPTLAANRGTEPAKLTRLVRGELDWIVMKALEKDRGRRYETANGFAMDVQRYLADEPVQACPPSAGYRFRKFARRNKTGLAVAALILFFIALLGGGGGWVIRDRAARDEEAAQERQDRERRLTGQVEQILDDVDRLAREQKWPEALAAVGRAEAALAGGEADAATAERVSDVRRDLEFVARLDRIRQERVVSVERRKVSYRRALQGYAQAFRKYRVDVEQLPAATAVSALRSRPGLAVPLAAALDDWVEARRRLGEGERSWGPLVAVARGVDPDPVRDRLRATWGRPVTPALQAELLRLAESIEVKTQSPATLHALASTLFRAALPDSAVQILRKGQHARPGDFWLNLDLALALLRRKDSAGAVRYFSVAISIRPDSTVARNDLGVALYDQKKLDEAIAEYCKAIELDPKDVVPWHNRGQAYLDLQQYDKALADCSRAIELDTKLPEAWCNRGNAYHGLKQYDKALADYSKAIEMKADYLRAWNNRGNTYRALQQYDKALADHSKAIELNADYADAWNSRGVTYHDLKQYDKALADYSKAIELDKKLALPWRNRGKAYLDLKQYDKAIADYCKAIDLDLKDDLAWNNRGEAYRHLKQYDKAIADYCKAIELDPLCAGYWNNRGLAYLDLTQYDKALADCSKAIDLKADYAEAWNSRGTVHEYLRQDDKALADYSKAIELKADYAGPWGNRGAVYRRLKQYDKALADCSRAIELDPKLATAWNNRGDAYRDLKQYDNALDDYSRAIELDPSIAIFWYNRGRVYHELHQYARALADYCKATDLDPKDAVAWNNRGQAYRYLKQYDKALDDYSRAIELDPSIAIFWYNRGRVYHALHQFDKAVADYSKAIELDPKNMHAWANRGIVYCDNLGQPEKAVADFSKAIELEPTNATLWSNRGNAHRKLRLYKEAVADFSKALDLDPKNAIIWYNRGLAYRNLRQYDKAVADFSEAIKLDPNFVNAWRNRGIAYCDHLGQPEKAVADFSRAIQLEPTNAVNWSNRGVAYRKLRQYAKAIADYFRAIDLDGKCASARNNLAWLLATCPDAKLRDPKRAVELARIAVQLSPDESNYWGTLGTAHYRAGDWKAAILAVGTSMEISKGGNAYDWFILAMSHWKLGEHPEARKHYHQALQWMKENEATLAKDMGQAEELRRFRSEAEEVLELKKK